MKRIIICCDGTWNTPDAAVNGTPCPTNVVKIAEAVSPHAPDGTRQLLYYDAGVGTAGSRARRAFDGATGSGLSASILKAYDFLMHHYDAGDELMLFGFSRGAFTVRSLAGFIRNSGVLRLSAASRVDHAFALYRSRSKASHPRAREATLFRRTYAVEDVTPVHFIGVWDTVGSLGNPLLLNGFISSRFRFHDTDLSTSVAHACQALAIDEKRLHFRHALWHQQPGAPPGQTLRQLWFAGVHADVGGGYADARPSRHALHWLAQQAQRHGLGLDPAPEASAPDAADELHESRRGPYRLLPPYHRPIGEVKPGRGPAHEAVHESALRRFELDDSYRPPGLVAYLGRFPQRCRTPMHASCP
jgi:uncharacterized protein (DUF2235 family)